MAAATATPASPEPGSDGCVRLARGQTAREAQPVVRLEQLRLVADVVPRVVEDPRVDGLPRLEPLDEAPRLVGSVPVGQ